MSDNNSWDIFIAYPHPNRQLAENLYSLLKTKCRVFLDSVNIPLGSDWDMEIQKALECSRITVVLVTENSNVSYYMRDEIAFAVKMSRDKPEGHIVIPIYLGVSPSELEKIPYGLRLKQGIYLSDDKELLKAAGALLKLQAIEIRESSENVKNDEHILRNFPRGPIVEGFRIPRSIIRAYASNIRSFEAYKVIDEANAFRREVDNNCTIIEHADLPPANSVRPYEFWLDVFSEACLHGPRMLAAILLTVPDDQFPGKTREAREELIYYLQFKHR